ncbi:DUF4149 domain-containing protein [Brumicola pallidula]|jgi:hypothetical protein|uniref:TMEM205-like domain-containing protein n=1 Tax=Brumicola pallidula DSM 14239 = ACAM 615 TaxID=1121922 RepID=K6ZGK0_9ALTE|nr:DUF4149 domain-containing protein [Glaciecola pallidula]GAC29477.1 hypothetical protein GPAL_2623 [Glaciecola pallidula DSM 14239 = ACAM 615]
MLDTLQLVLLSVIFGGMVTFQILFAPLVFIKLSIDTARPFIRAFFPFYYLYFSIFSFAYLIVCLLEGDGIQAIIAGVALVGFLISRQILMPMANAASDNNQKSKFDLLHRGTVVINTLQLVAFFSALVLV